MQFLLWFVLGAVASTGPIDLDMEVELAPGKVLKPSVTVRDGSWATVTQGPLELRIRAKRGEDDSVNVEAEIRENVKGVPVLRGIPSILTQWGKSAEIRAENKNKTLQYRFKVTPDRG